MLDAHDARRLRECVLAGGVALLPTDTVYGLACDPLQPAAVKRLYELKGRPPAQPAAIMFFALAPALAVLPELGERERAALAALLPGPLTLLLPNRARRYPLSGGGETLGLRVPALAPALAALGAVDVPVLQSSANLSGGPEARRLEDVAPSVRDGAALELDGGELPGVASTVLDLREHELHGRWRIVRAGPVGEAELEKALEAADASP
ncbi:MAG TPA: Sua5/YciO/YrdC/YwlC family protein [Solirubrobacteraceae bacterium]|nr:Sua5/YciO/YrdC/YwlC family protein [Solirubrobacteraceae bacterium]